MGWIRILGFRGMDLDSGILGAGSGSWGVMGWICILGLRGWVWNLRIRGLDPDPGIAHSLLDLVLGAQHRRARTWPVPPTHVAQAMTPAWARQQLLLLPMCAGRLLEQPVCWPMAACLSSPRATEGLLVSVQATHY